MRSMSRGVTLAAALAATAGLALAVDTTMPLNSAIVKPTKTAKFVSHPGLGSLNGDPTVGGATLRLKDTGNGANVNTYALPAGNWKGLGNPSGSKGFKYKGTQAPG